MSSIDKASRLPLRSSLLATLALLALLCSALPASAGTLISTIKTPIYPVPAGQSLYVTVADVMDSERGGQVEIELYDDTGAKLTDLQQHLSKNRAVTLGVNSDDVPFAGPFLQVRAVIKVKKDTSSDLATSLTILTFDPLGLTSEVHVKCVGPSADDPETEFNGGDCPGVWRATQLIP